MAAAPSTTCNIRDDAFMPASLWVKGPANRHLHNDDDDAHTATRRHNAWIPKA